MRNSSAENIIVFVIVCTLLIVVLISFITFIVYRYQQKQNAYFRSIKELKVEYETAMLQAQLEMQEQTFENISREIHDNIGQKLTLAKLQLNTLDIDNANEATSQLNDSIIIIGEAISDLSNISRSMSSEIILNNGLIKALEFEVLQMNKLGIYRIHFAASGNSIFMNSQTELVVFRIIQEALNNIIKHSFADMININLDYSESALVLSISDNGRGFSNVTDNKVGTGLSNMRKRAEMLGGQFTLATNTNEGTSIKIQIPIHEN